LLWGKWVTPGVPGLTLVSVTVVAWLGPAAADTMATAVSDTKNNRTRFIAPPSVCSLSLSRHHT
jgi:hypothetical protein